MNLQLDDLTINMSRVDVADIRECWEWLLKDMPKVLMISKLGDMFLEGRDNGIYWLDTGIGELNKITDSISEFQQLLKDDEAVDNWFLPELISGLVDSGITLDSDEVYSYKKLPLIGGEYSVENLEPTNISVHFAISGQIAEQVKNLPDGTPVKIVLKD